LFVNDAAQKGTFSSNAAAENRGATNDDVRLPALTATKPAQDAAAAAGISRASDSDLWTVDTSTNDLAYRLCTRLAQVVPPTIRF